MESLCRAFPTNPREAEEALIELRRSEHAVEVAKTILGEHEATWWDSGLVGAVL